MLELALFVGGAVAVGLLAIWFSSDLLLLISKPANWILRVIGWQEAPTVTENLNSPLQKMVGKRGIVVREFSDGRGRIKAGNSEWPAEWEGESEVPKLGEACEIRRVSKGVLVVGSIENESA